MAVKGNAVRIASDIGGTFTDIVLEIGGTLETTKVLTRHEAPELGVLEGIDTVIDRAGLKPSDVDFMVHGTTLATNALIERRGARIVMLTTSGFRDTIEIRTESRFEQYDLNIAYPEPLVPRARRLTVLERLDSFGRVIVPLEQNALETLYPAIEAAAPEAIAICFINSYVNPAHEARARELIGAAFPELPISISSEVGQEMREFARFSTTCANAYVQPMMSAYLENLDRSLIQRGFSCPLLLMLSGGGLTNVATAIRFPVRLVESGPAGGAVFASDIARQCGLSNVLSFDMGGTTAKLCLISDCRPQTAREFEVARAHRFRKGSGIPLRIPVVELVEIGAGGGSIAKIDSLNNVVVGPESAGSEPGPACYGRGGQRATVSDSNLLLGRLDADNFAGGRIKLDVDAARLAVASDVGAPLGLDASMAAFGVIEMVEENMVGAARVHAVESGRDVEKLVMIAFGGGAPLHAGAMALKLGIARFIVPASAGVGSAIGFLRAPVAYEIVRSFLQRVSALDSHAVNAMFLEMSAQARAVVEPASLGAPLSESRVAYMRYVGQGHEVAVDIPEGDIDAGQISQLASSFEDRYRELFTWLVPNAQIEVVTWSLKVSAPVFGTCEATSTDVTNRRSPGLTRRPFFDASLPGYRELDVYERTTLSPGHQLQGPVIIVEDETSTYVPAEYSATIDVRGFIDCRLKC